MILSTIVLFWGANARESYLGVGYTFVRSRVMLYTKTAQSATIIYS